MSRADCRASSTARSRLSCGPSALPSKSTHHEPRLKITTNNALDMEMADSEWPGALVPPISADRLREIRVTHNGMAAAAPLRNGRRAHQALVEMNQTLNGSCSSRRFSI